MTRFETDLQMTERHVREGEVQLAQQRHILSWLADHHYATDEAERLLAIFEDIQQMHREHYARLRAP